MYQDHLTASVSLCLLVFGRPLLPASFHVAAQSCCFQASTGGQVALLLLLPDQHSRSGCTAAVLLVLHRRSALQHCMADLDISCAGLSVALSVIATLSSSSHSRASHSSNKLWLCYKCCDKHHSLQCSSTASVILKCILQCWSC
ncbi:TPA: hypothetical protein ACH3X2_14290 [Trebouxia sp. C0005]